MDQWGVRADIIMDGDSTIKRMNIGRVYEQYTNAVSNQIHRKVIADVDAGVSTGQIWSDLVKYYTTASPIMGKLVQEKMSGNPKLIESHIKSVYDNGVYLWIPTHSPTIGDQQIVDLRNAYPIPKGPVTYRGKSGNVCTTESDILISSMYIILLEKTGGEWAAISSAKRQHFGLLAKLTNGDKYSLPWRDQPVRLLGEAEVRLFLAVAGPEITADLLEIPNSPAASKAIVKNILQADKPTAINEVLCRKEVPRGVSRSTMFVNHIFMCTGFEYCND